MDATDTTVINSDPISTSVPSSTSSSGGEEPVTAVFQIKHSSWPAMGVSGLAGVLNPPRSEVSHTDMVNVGSVFPLHVCVCVSV